MFTNQTNHKSAVGTNAIGQAVTFLFPISETSDIVVKSVVTLTGVETLLAITTNYTVAIAADDGGGTVTMVTAVAATSTIHITRATPATQELDLVAGGSFNAENIEDALDKTTKLAIDNSKALDFCLRLPDTDSESAELSTFATRAGKFLYFGAGDGAPTVASSVTTGAVVLSAFAEELVDDADAGAMFDTLGVSAFAQTILDDADSAATQATLDLLDYSTTLKLADIELKGPWVDVRAFGATGDGVTNDGAAIQAALDYAGYVNMTYAGTSPTITGRGGVPVYIPPGNYLVTTTLYFYPAQRIFGAGVQSSICFAPITALKNLFEKKAGTGQGGAVDIFRYNIFEKFQVTSTTNTYAQDAFYFYNVSQFTMRNVTVKDFKLGLYIGGDSAQYYNKLDMCEFHRCETAVESVLGSVTNFSSCLFKCLGVGTWGATSEYEIKLNGGSTYNFYNCAFEGTPSIAHVHAEAGATSFWGGYTENATFILLDMDEETRSYGQVSVMGVHHGTNVYPLLKFANVDTEPGETNTFITYGVTLGQQYRFLPIVSNPTGKRGLMDWTASDGTTTQSPEVFGSRYGWEITADVDGDSQLSRAAGKMVPMPRSAKFTVTFMAKIEDDGDITTSSSVQPVGGDVNRFKERIDYGNDWKLYACTLTNDGTSTEMNISIKLYGATSGKSAYVTNVRVYEGEGWDIFPSDTDDVPKITHTGVPTVGTWEAGDQVWTTTPAGGATPGWVCVTSGTFNAATDAAGDTDGSTGVITGMADTSDFFPGDYITTSAGFANSVDDGDVPVRIISKTATTLTIDEDSDSAVNNITVLTPDPVFKTMAILGA